MKQKLNYIGSKYSLLSFIEETIEENIEEKMSELSFCDIFSGSGIVSRYFSNKFKKVISNDLEYYSFIILKAYLTSNPYSIERLNKIEGVEGPIFHKYSVGGNDGRMYFSEENGKKIDGIRKEINNLSEEEKTVALCSLIEASDKVANTTSVYGAFLKQLKKSAKKDIFLENIEYCFNSENEVFQEDANDLITKISGDVLYMDPPYNTRQYSGNYHILNTIAKYDDFNPKGVTGQRIDNNISAYCSKKNCEEAFDFIIKNSKFKYIFVSYNNEGLINQENIKIILSKYGDYSFRTKTHKTFKADKKRNNKSDRVQEFIHILRKK